MKRSKKALISTVAVIGLTMGSISMVSAFGGSGGFGGCHGGHGYWQQSSGKMTEKQNSWMQQRMQDRVDFMKYKLGITKDQEPAWQEFTKVMESKFTTMRDRMEKRGEQQSVTERVKLMRTGAEHMTQMADAIEKLYTALTPEQQKIADQLRPMGRRGF